MSPRHLSALEPERDLPLCSRALQTSPPPNTTGLSEFYRLALLLTGSVNTAEQILADTLAEANAHVAQVRRASGRQAWLVQRIRERCLKNDESAPPTPPAEAPADGLPVPAISDPLLLARRFHTLPEPERTALALFYLDLFTVAEIAEVLKMSIEALSETLAAARQFLGHALRGVPGGEGTEP